MNRSGRRLTMAASWSFVCALTKLILSIPCVSSSASQRSAFASTSSGVFAGGSLGLVAHSWFMRTMRSAAYAAKSGWIVSVNDGDGSVFSIGKCACTSMIGNGREDAWLDVAMGAVADEGVEIGVALSDM